MTCAAVILILITTVAASFAEPIAPGAIDVIDGDTIRAHGRSVRLVGFDAPESGLRAQCESERALAAKASFRLRQLVSAGGLDLELGRIDRFQRLRQAARRIRRHT